MSRLYAPFQLGDLTLRNRIAMAPCSRHRAHLDGTPTPMMVEYYRQRAGAGLLISEAIACSPTAVGYVFTPGLYTEGHVCGWRAVTDAVHREGGAIYAQLFHAGRMSDALIQPGMAVPLAPSAVQPNPLARHYTVTCPRPKRVYQMPRAMTLREVQQTIGDFATAARRAQEAGFDGVEIHGGSGYLAMQFLCTNTNLREDEYGGSVAGRARFLLDCVAAIQGATHESFVAVKLSPAWTFHDVFDDDPVATYGYVSEALSARRIAYLQVGNFQTALDIYPIVRPRFGGPLMGVKGFSRSQAMAAVDAGELELVAFGQAFIANPDLVERFRHGWPLNPPDAATFYTQGVEGYTDYPVHAQGNVETMVPVESAFGAGASGSARKSGS